MRMTASARPNGTPFSAACRATRSCIWLARRASSPVSLSRPLLVSAWGHGGAASGDGTRIRYDANIVFHGLAKLADPFITNFVGIDFTSELTNAVISLRPEPSITPRMAAGGPIN